MKPGDRDPPLSVLQLGDDPEGRAAKVQSQWIVAHSVNYGLEKPDGKQEACSALTFQKGDFVEVAFTVDILTTFVKNRKATDISFVMEEVLRLRPASETKVCWLTCITSNYLEHRLKCLSSIACRRKPSPSHQTRRRQLLSRLLRD